jgi:hypothetical protein
MLGAFLAIVDAQCLMVAPPRFADVPSLFPYRPVEHSMPRDWFGLPGQVSGCIISNARCINFVCRPRQKLQLSEREEDCEGAVYKVGVRPRLAYRVAGCTTYVDCRFGGMPGIHYNV